MDLIYLLQILKSFLSGGGYFPENISRKFCEEFSFACLGYQLSDTLQSVAQKPFRNNMAAFSEGFNCHINQKQLNSELQFTGTEPTEFILFAMGSAETKE